MSISSRTTFCVPKPKKQEDLLSGLEQFDWKALSEFRRIGNGSYGFVDFAKYKKNASDLGHLPVIVKQPFQIAGHEKEFAKEARLLQSVGEHQNIVKFIAVCSRPTHALMQEYVAFSFAPFGDNKVVSSLADFSNHVDTVFDFEGFENVPPIAMEDIIDGVAFLHGKGIVHRDLKPGNILVSNQHYEHLPENIFRDQWEAGTLKPIVCKLTDFGESRSALIQTNTLLQSKATNLDRGSPAYMSPEILLPEMRPKNGSIADLKAVDIWALGMVLFDLADPSSKYPYHQEIESDCNAFPFKTSRESLGDLMRKKMLPSPTPKYQVLQATHWDTVFQVHKRCVTFESEKRLRTASQVKDFLEDRQISVPCNIINLAVSQTSGLQEYDRRVAEKFAASMELTLKGTSCTVTKNDGTNACVFLCLKVLDEVSRLMTSSAGGEVLTDEIERITTEVISNFPTMLNEYREKNLLYTVMSAYVIMRDNNLLASNFEFTEELPYEHTVYSSEGRQHLEQKIRALDSKGDFLAIYTCEPYSLIIGSINRQLFLVDTHPVPVKCDGNLNGQIRVYSPSDKRSCRALCSWLWHRLSESGVGKMQGQSFAVAWKASTKLQSNEEVRQILKQQWIKHISAQ